MLNIFSKFLDLNQREIERLKKTVDIKRQCIPKDNNLIIKNVHADCDTRSDMYINIYIYVQKCEFLGVLGYVGCYGYSITVSDRTLKCLGGESRHTLSCQRE